MKKRNIIFLLSVLLLSSIFMATSCKDDEDNTPTTTAENPMFRNKINEIKGYVGMSNEEFNKIMKDSYGLEEFIFYTSGGYKHSYYNHENPTFQYSVECNTFTSKICGISYIHFLDYDTLVKYYEGYSRLLYNTIPKSYYYIGQICGKDGSEYETSNKDEFKNKFKIKKHILYYCVENYSGDSVMYNLKYSDKLHNFAQNWISFTFVDLRLYPPPYPGKK